MTSLTNRGVPVSIEQYLDNTNRKALGEIKNQFGQLWDIGSEEWSLPDVARRLSWSLSKDENGKFVPSIRAAKADSWVLKRLTVIKEDYPSVQIAYTDGGEAQSAYVKQKFKKHAVSGKLKPGASISHGRYRSGTLGCVVEVAGEQKDEICLISAAHVVALSDFVEEGNKIYSPGKGSIERITTRENIGVLTDNIIPLFPINEADEDNPAEDIAIDIDVALIRLNERGSNKSPLRNFVPDPAKFDPRKIDIDTLPQIHVNGCYKEDKMNKDIGLDVCMLGAVSGFRSGVLTDTLIDYMVVKLPNNKNYLYHDLFAVAPADTKPFSQDGDSGSMIYTADGKLVGFLVGGDDYVSFGCVGERVLSQFRARLV